MIAGRIGVSRLAQTVVTEQRVLLSDIIDRFGFVGGFDGIVISGIKFVWRYANRFIEPITGELVELTLNTMVEPYTIIVSEKAVAA